MFEISVQMTKNKVISEISPALVYRQISCKYTGNSFTKALAIYNYNDDYRLGY